MCHPDKPAGTIAATANTVTVDIAASGADLMPVQLFSPTPHAEHPGRETPEAVPEGGGDQPTVVVVADMYGPSDFYRDLCTRLTARGMKAALPDYFFRQGALSERTPAAAMARRAELDEELTLADLRSLIEWTRAPTREGGAVAPVGVIGFCMGGTFALDLAALEEQLVVVAYYGFPVPQATVVSPPPAPLELAPQIRGPVLAFWGDRDETVGMDNVERFVAAMGSSAAGFQHHIYDGLGHGFLAQSLLPDHPDENDHAGHSWLLALEHLQSHLGAVSPLEAHGG